MNRFRISSVGLSHQESRFLDTVVDLVSGIDIGDWEVIASRADADVVLVDLDSSAGTDFLKDHEDSALPILVLKSSDKSKLEGAKFSMTGDLGYNSFRSVLAGLPAVINQRRSDGYQPESEPPRVTLAVETPSVQDVFAAEPEVAQSKAPAVNPIPTVNPIPKAPPVNPMPEAPKQDQTRSEAKEPERDYPVNPIPPAPKKKVEDKVSESSASRGHPVNPIPPAPKSEAKQEKPVEGKQPVSGHPVNAIPPAPVPKPVQNVPESEEESQPSVNPSVAVPEPEVLEERSAELNELDSELQVDDAEPTLFNDTVEISVVDTTPKHEVLVEKPSTEAKSSVIKSGDTAEVVVQDLFIDAPEPEAAGINNNELDIPVDSLSSTVPDEKPRDLSRSDVELVEEIPELTDLVSPNETQEIPVLSMEELDTQNQEVVALGEAERKVSNVVSFRRPEVFSVDAEIGAMPATDLGGTTLSDISSSELQLENPFGDEPEIANEDSEIDVELTPVDTDTSEISDEAHKLKVPVKKFYPATSLLGHLQSAVYGDSAVLVTHEDYPDLFVNPELGVFACEEDLASCEGIYTEPFYEFQVVDIPWKRRPKGHEDPLWMLLYEAAYIGARGRLISTADPDETFLLTDVPDFSNVSCSDIDTAGELAALLLNREMGYAQIAAESSALNEELHNEELQNEELHNLMSAWLAAGFMYQPSQGPAPDEFRKRVSLDKHSGDGFFGRLKKTFGGS